MICSVQRLQPASDSESRAVPKTNPKYLLKKFYDGQRHDILRFCLSIYATSESFRTTNTLSLRASKSYLATKCKRRTRELLARHSAFMDRIKSRGSTNFESAIFFLIFRATKMF